MKKIRFLSVILTIALFVSLFPIISTAETVVKAGDSFTYTKAEHFGKENDLWSWQWALSDSESFSDMTFTTVDGQGECYVADWEKYPYCIARNGGINVHPNVDADTARVFTAPASGWVTITASVARASAYTTPSSKSPTSFRILLESTTIYPTVGDYLILTSTKAENITAKAFVKKGEKLRFVVGAMDNQQSDGVNLQTTITYDTVGEAEICRVGESFTYKKTSATWGTDDPHWYWEWTPASKATFSPMTYQYVEKYGRYMYASDWSTNPYNYVDSLGVKLHPAENVDTVKTFVVPYTGTVDLSTEVSRYTNLSDVTTSGANGTSLRILVNTTQVYPLYSSTLVLDSTTAKNFTVSLPVTAGDKIRIIIGGMGQVTSDAVKMYNTVTYTSTETPEICVSDYESFSATQEQWESGNMGNWSFEYRDSDDTFGAMTYQYSDYYNKYIYASDWSKHVFNYADLLGVKLHPAKDRDAVKTYTAAYDGRIRMNIRVSRYNEYVQEGNKTPTSLRIYKNDEQIWPTNGSQKELTSTDEFTLNVYADVLSGDKIRCVIGSMGNTTADAVKMYNTVYYRAVGTRELVALTDQYNQRIDVIDVQGDNLDSAETAWSWKPTEALGFSNLTTFNSPTEAKLRYSKELKKYVIAVCSSRGFMGVVDFATGKNLWQVSLTDEANPHSIEYLPNGNVAVAASHGNWVRIYTASQSKTSSTYAQATLEGAHGVLWDNDRQLLWALGTEEITAYKIGGTAAKPTLTEQTAYHVAFTDDIRSGHDLAFVQGNNNRLWITSKTVMQYDIPTKSIVLEYDQSDVLAHNAVKGIGNFPDSTTVAYVYPNKTYLDHDSDRIFVNIHQDGRNYGITHTHSTGAYYKVRSWISSYNPQPHRSHRAMTVQGTEPTCIANGLTDGTKCSICGMILKAQTTLPALGHSYTYTDNGENHTIGCINCDYSANEDHTYVDGACICGEKEVKEPVLNADLTYTMSISVGSEMQVKYTIPSSKVKNFTSFYLEVVKEVYGSESVATIYSLENENLELTYHPVSGAVVGYAATYTGIFASQMGDNFTATLYAVSADGTIHYSEDQTSSIKSSLYEKIETGSSELKTLAVDMLNYGAAAQIFFNYNTEDLVNADLTEEQKALGTQTMPSAIDNSSIAGDGCKVATSVSLQSKVLLYINCTYTSNENSNLKFVIKDLEGKVLEEFAPNVINARVCQGVYDNVGAKQMRDLVTIELLDNGVTVSKIVTWNVESYVAQTRATATEEAKINAVNAMLIYGDSAAIYLESTGQ